MILIVFFVLLLLLLLLLLVVLWGATSQRTLGATANNTNRVRSVLVDAGDAVEGKVGAVRCISDGGGRQEQRGEAAGGLICPCRRKLLLL